MDVRRCTGVCVVFGAWVLFGVQLLLHAQVACPRDAAQTLDCGKQFFAAQQLKPAEASTRQYLVLHPDSADGMYLLGRILQEKNEAAESLSWFTKAAAIRQPSGDDLRVVAMDYVLLNSYSDAARWLSRSVQMDPANAEAWYALGRSKMMLGDMHGARAPLERSLALRPKESKVANNLGVVAEAENHPEEAVAFYKDAIEWQLTLPHPSEQPYLNLGTLLTTQQQAAEALPLLAEAVKLAPDDPKCNEELARAEEQQGDFSHAIDHLSHAVALQPKSAHLHFELGQLYRHAGQPEKAKQELTLSSQLYGSHSSDAEP